MFKGANNLEFIDIKKTLPLLNQEDLFAKYTGIWPELNKRYYSLFRNDKKPGCRFKWHSGILYFVENVGYNGKLYFNIVDTISTLQGISIKEAINKIAAGNITLLNSLTTTFITKDAVKPEIRFKYKEWENNNYFGISPFHLYNENVFNVTHYWIKQNNEWKYNCLHNPQQTLTIAYYFPDTNNVKLYFPEKKEFKWYSNCGNNDIFGEAKLDFYLERNNNLIIITKSQKDRLLLDYKYGYNAIAPQNEGVDFSHIVPKLKKFNNQLILFDNDITGEKYASYYSEKYQIPWLNLAISKDVYEADMKYGYNNVSKYIDNEIKYN